MNSNTSALSPRSSIARRVLGSFLSAFFGWFALNAFITIWTTLQQHHERDWWLLPVFFGIYSAAFVFGTWIVVLLPLYFLVPLHSWLWRWYVCTPCGATSGALIMYVWVRYTSPQATDWPFYVILAATTAGLTCLFGSLTSRRFQYEQVA